MLPEQPAFTYEGLKEKFPYYWYFLLAENGGGDTASRGAQWWEPPRSRLGLIARAWKTLQEEDRRRTTGEYTLNRISMPRIAISMFYCFEDCLIGRVVSVSAGFYSRHSHSFKSELGLERCPSRLVRTLIAYLSSRIVPYPKDRLFL